MFQPTVLRMFGGCDPSTATPQTILDMQAKLQKEFEPVQCEVQDPLGDQSHVQIFIVSEKFEGKLPLAKQRMVNAVIKDEIKMIHAVTIEAKTPKQINR